MKVALLCVLLWAVADARPRRPRLVVNQFKTRHLGPSTFIVGGSNAPKGTYPHQLSLQFLSGGEWFHVCGASIFKTNRALTAAHCTDGGSTATLRVLAGAYDMGNNDDHDAEQIGILSAIIDHPQYDNAINAGPYDVSVLPLTAHFDTSNQYIAAYPLGQSQIGSRNDGWISGWGRFDGTINSRYRQLQHVQIPVITNSVCQQRLGAQFAGNLQDQHICVHGGTNGGIGACQGDSGGPLTVDNTIAGVTSWVLGNTQDSCLTAYPSVYARVSWFYSWINAQ